MVDWMRGRVPMDDHDYRLVIEVRARMWMTMMMFLLTMVRKIIVLFVDTLHCPLGDLHVAPIPLSNCIDDTW